MSDSSILSPAPDSPPAPNPRASLALCMIVRDAAKTIDALLGAVLPAGRPLSEYVFVDTGSADDTRERIAGAFAASGRWRLWNTVRVDPDGRRWEEARPSRGAGTECAPVFSDCPGRLCSPCGGRGRAVDAPTGNEIECDECGGVGTVPDFVRIYRADAPPEWGARGSRDIRLVLARWRWRDDFSAARNFSFSLASAPWIAWLDADDVPADVDAWETTLATATATFPGMNAAGFDYDYAPGTVEPRRVRFVRRDAGWRWGGVGAARGRIHEQLRLADGRPHPVALPFRVAHLPAPDRDVASDLRQRNRRLELMELADCEAADDKLGASVMHSDLAREHANLGETEDAAAHARAAVRDSDGGLPGAVALLALARARLHAQDFVSALGYAGEAYAHARDPQSLAILVLAAKARGRNADAAAWYQQCCGMPGAALWGIWDPVLMDGWVHCAGANALLDLGRVDEAAAALARVTPDARKHETTGPVAEQLEARIRATLEVGPGEKRVAILVPAPIPFDAESPRHGHVGGSEEAVIHLSRALARRGCDVTVFTHPVAGRPQLPDGGVLWRPFAEGNPALMPKGSAVLVWRMPALATDPALATCRARKVLWLHDASYGVAPTLYGAWDRVVVLSDAHVKSLRERDKYDGPTARGANGIEPAEFPPPDEALRDPHRCVYASSPNRGLDHLLAIWPDVRAAVPDATLDVGYGWEKFIEMFPAWAARLKARMAELPGVTFHGGLSHGTLHDLLRRAGVLAYPCSYWEVYNILSVKAQAAGCWPVTVRVGSVPEIILTGDLVDGIDWTKWPAGEPPHEAVLWEESGYVPPGKDERGPLFGLRDEFTARYRDALIRRLLNPPTAAERAAMREKVLGRFSWEAAAEKFEAILFGPDPETSMSTGENDVRSLPGSP